MNKIRKSNKARTYATLDEIIWLKAQAKRLPVDAEVVMLGSGLGITAMVIALIEERSDIWITAVDNMTYDYLAERIKQLRLASNRLYCMIENSSQVEWGGEPIDFLVINNNHGYEEIKADLNVWLKHVKPDGLIFIHDYDAGNTYFNNYDADNTYFNNYDADNTCFTHQDRYSGVRQAVEECRAQWRKVERIGTAIVFRMSKN